MLEALQLYRGQLGQVGDALDRRQAGAAFEPGREYFGQQRHAEAGGEPSRGHQRRLAQRAPAQQQGRATAAGQ